MSAKRKSTATTTAAESSSTAAAAAAAAAVSADSKYGPDPTVSAVGDAGIQLDSKHSVSANRGVGSGDNGVSRPKSGDGKSDSKSCIECGAPRLDSVTKCGGTICAAAPNADGNAKTIAELAKTQSERAVLIPLSSTASIRDALEVKDKARALLGQTIEYQTAANKLRSETSALADAKSYEVRTAVFADAAARQKTADAIVASLQTVHHLYTRFIETEDVATAVKLNGLPVHVPDLVAYFEKHPEPYQPASNAWRSSPSAAGNVNSNGNGNNNGNGTANPSPAKRGKTDGNEPWIVRKIEMLLQSTKPLWHNISQAPLKEGHKCQICNSNMHYATDVITDPSGEFVYLCPKMAPHKVVSAGRDVNTK